MGSCMTLTQIVVISCNQVCCSEAAVIRHKLINCSLASSHNQTCLSALFPIYINPSQLLLALQYCASILGSCCNTEISSPQFDWSRGLGVCVCSEEMKDSGEEETGKWVDVSTQQENWFDINSVTITLTSQLPFQLHRHRHISFSCSSLVNQWLGRREKMWLDVSFLLGRGETEILKLPKRSNKWAQMSENIYFPVEMSATCFKVVNKRSSKGIFQLQITASVSRMNCRFIIRVTWWKVGIHPEQFSSVRLLCLFRCGYILLSTDKHHNLYCDYDLQSHTSRPNFESPINLWHLQEW